MSDFHPKTVCVIGLGYIGLPTAAFFSKVGLEVVGVDIDQNKIDLINKGISPFSEPGFESILSSVVKSRKLVATDSPVESDAFIISVPTPFKEDHEVDLSFIDEATKSIAAHLRPGNLVVLESTSPPGTTERVARCFSKMRPDLSVDGENPNAVLFAHCPERVIPGSIVSELVKNDRVVGGLTRSAAKRARDLYSSFCEGEIVLTDAKTAELSKLAENSFRDVNIAFANELSMLADKFGVDVWELIEIANRHPRVNILQPGPGVGGHCIAVDPWFLVSAAPELTKLIKSARLVNDEKTQFIVRKASSLIREKKAKVVGVLGLTFKANVDDLRESPAIKILSKLAGEFSDVEFLVVDPHIKRLPNELIGQKNVRRSGLREAETIAQVTLLLVDHNEFKSLSRETFTNSEILDTKGMLCNEL